MEVRPFTMISGNGWLAFLFSNLQEKLEDSSARLLKKMLISLAKEGQNNLAVNLTDVEYMDSEALGILIGGLKQMRGHGRLHLFWPISTIPEYHGVLDITGLDKVFKVYKTVRRSCLGHRTPKTHTSLSWDALSQSRK